MHNLLIFAVAGLVIWYSGTRLTRYLDAIALKTRMDHAFVGMLLLGGITSLPEVANVTTASAIGNPALAINVLLLAIADGFAAVTIGPAAETLVANLTRHAVPEQGSRQRPGRSGEDDSRNMELALPRRDPRRRHDRLGRDWRDDILKEHQKQDRGIAAAFDQIADQSLMAARPG